MLMYRQLFGRIRTQLLPFRLVTTLWGASMHCCLSVDAKQPSIQPSHTEQKIFQLLKDVVRERHLRCELRVAGGWVRDKVMDWCEKDARKQNFPQLSNSEKRYDASLDRVT